MECDGNCFECGFPDCVNDAPGADPFSEEFDLLILRERAYGSGKEMKPKKTVNVWYEQNREVISEKRKAYYRKNRERIIERQKKRYYENRDKLIAYQKVRYRENREKLIAYQKLRYQSKKEGAEFGERKDSDYDGRKISKASS